MERAKKKRILRSVSLLWVFALLAIAVLQTDVWRDFIVEWWGPMSVLATIASYLVVEHIRQQCTHVTAVEEALIYFGVGRRLRFPYRASTITSFSLPGGQTGCAIACRGRYLFLLGEEEICTRLTSAMTHVSLEHLVGMIHSGPHLLRHYLIGTTPALAAFLLPPTRAAAVTGVSALILLLPVTHFLLGHMDTKALERFRRRLGDPTQFHPLRDVSLGRRGRLRCIRSGRGFLSSRGPAASLPTRPRNRFRAEPGGWLAWDAVLYEKVVRENPPRQWSFARQLWVDMQSWQAYTLFGPWLFVAGVITMAGAPILGLLLGLTILGLYVSLAATTVKQVRYSPVLHAVVDTVEAFPLSHLIEFQGALAATVRILNGATAKVHLNRSALMFIEDTPGQTEVLFLHDRDAEFDVGVAVRKFGATAESQSQ